jgi:ankyrin repeat protein
MTPRACVFSLIFLLFSLTAQAGQEGHGGDAVAYEFIETARGIAEGLERTRLDSLPSPEFSVDLRRVIGKTLVRSDVGINLDGIEVDAINYPGKNPPLILVNRNRWFQYTSQFHRKRILVLHEYLSILGIPDTRYEISAELLSRLELSEATLRGGKQAELATMIQRCDKAAAERLVAEGVNFRIRFDGGDTALHLAASSGCLPLVDYFLRLGILPNTLNEMGWNALFSSVWHFHYSAPNSPRRDLFRASIRRLLDAGADINLQTASTMESMLHFPVVIRSHQTVLTRALMGVYDLDAPGMHLSDDPELVDELLSLKSLDVNLADSQGFTALHYAVALGRLDYVNKLLQRGADANLRNLKNETALDFAATSQERLLFLPSLIQAGGKVSTLTLTRALNAVTNLESETLSILSQIANAPELDPNLALFDAIRLSFRLATQRGVRSGARVMQILVSSKGFDPKSCTAWYASIELNSLVNSRYSDIYRETKLVLDKALKGLTMPDACLR